MKIAIITLPLHVNYGGLLQAYALKSVLEGMDNEVTVLDPKDKMPLPLWWKAPAIYLKRALLNLVNKGKGPEVFRELRARRDFPVISANTGRFVAEYINPRVIKDYDEIEEEFDAFVVGSDQVWRPRYFGKIENAFLDFTSEWDVLRISYAASFGTDELEYEYAGLEECSRLLQRFDAVSVREDSAVKICDEWFSYKGAVQVLDPVMLLSAQTYLDMAAKDPFKPAEGKIITYMLDKHNNTGNISEFVSKVTGNSIYDISVNPGNPAIPVQDRVVPPVERWIASIANSSFVITDSFPVCVLSILFHKPFLVIANSARGLPRISSLLRLFGLDSRLVQGIDPEDDGQGWLLEIDWDSVDKALEEQRKLSVDFLKRSIERRSEDE